MQTIITILALVSLILFFVGIFSPATSLWWDKKSEQTRGRSSLFYGVSFLILIFALGKVSKQEEVSNFSSTNIIKEDTYKKYRASELTAFYEENEVKADLELKGKTIYVTGFVSQIKKDVMGNIYVTLKGGDTFREVQCFLKDEMVASELKKGMSVTFKGNCKGLMMNVLVEDCEFI